MHETRKELYEYLIKFLVNKGAPSHVLSKVEHLYHVSSEPFEELCELYNKNDLLTRLQIENFIRKQKELNDGHKNQND